MIWVAIIGALLEAVGTVFEKKTLKNRFLNYKNYNSIVFLLVFLVALPFAVLTWRIDPGAFSYINLAIFFGIVVISFFANALVIYALKKEDIKEFEPIWLLQPFFTILLAVIIFEAERNYTIIVLAFIASLALIASHIKKHHLSFDKYAIAVLLAGLLFSIELIMSKFILQYYSPFTFYAIRCFFITILFFAVFRSKIDKGIDGKLGIKLIGVAFIWVFYRVLLYISYEAQGVVFSTLLFVLSPIFMLVLASIMLKEKMTKRQLFFNSIILVCVALAVVLE